MDHGAGARSTRTGPTGMKRGERNPGPPKFGGPGCSIVEGRAQPIANGRPKKVSHSVACLVSISTLAVERACA